MLQKMEIIVRYKENCTDNYYLDTIKVWATNPIRAIELVKRMWYRRFELSDLILLSITA